MQMPVSKRRTKQRVAETSRISDMELSFDLSGRRTRLAPFRLGWETRKVADRGNARWGNWPMAARMPAHSTANATCSHGNTTALPPWRAHLRASLQAYLVKQHPPSASRDEAGVPTQRSGNQFEGTTTERLEPYLLLVSFCYMQAQLARHATRFLIRYPRCWTFKFYHTYTRFIIRQCYLGAGFSRWGAQLTWIWQPSPAASLLSQLHQLSLARL
ncbi:hypothetical protein ACQKWADRAFT_234798 [Trichoderma austrokoningii]